MDTEMPAPDAPPAIWALTPGGSRLALKLARLYPGARVFLGQGAAPVEDNATPLPIHRFTRLSRELAIRFRAFPAHIFIFSTGIALRVLAPLMKNKQEDPAVVLLDEGEQNVISLLSGHIGGANALTRELAEKIKANPVITTATDVNDLPAIDTLAVSLGLVIENRQAIKAVNLGILQGKRVQLIDTTGELAAGLPGVNLEIIHDSKGFSPEESIPKVFCSWRDATVPRGTLILRPRCLTLGMGCNRNTPLAELREFAQTTLAHHGISRASITTLATTTVKADEPGLLALAEAWNLPMTFYDKSHLNSVDTIETPSEMVEKHLGVKSVCEAAAILAANHGRLILPKQKNPNVTLAVAWATSM